MLHTQEKHRTQQDVLGTEKGGTDLIEIDEELCKGCAICITFCPKEVFKQSDRLNRKGYYLPDIVKEEECVGCRLCELLCPEFSITITNE